MIIITSPEQFKNQIKKAKELKPRVWSNSLGIIFVEGQTQDYRVEFGKVGGQFAGKCNCQAHIGPNRLTAEQRLAWKPKECYHLVAGMTLYKIQVGIRRQVKAANSPSVSNWIVSEGKEAA